MSTELANLSIFVFMPAPMLPAYSCLGMSAAFTLYRSMAGGRGRTYRSATGSDGTTGIRK